MKLFEKSHYALAVLFVLHVVGAIGLNTQWEHYFRLLTPVNLLVSTAILILFQEQKNKAFWLVAIFIYILGFGAEWLGVKTGKIFGVYAYGATLGFKLDEIPLVIGINWLMLVLASSAAANRLPLPWFIKSFVAAGLMVFMDYLIEPVAIKYDMWSWETLTIPLQNYVAWFVIAWIMTSVYFYLRFSKSNKVAVGLYLILFGFFTILNFTL